MDFDIVSGDFWGSNPHNAMRWMRENEPVYRDEKNKIWGITKYDHVREIETDPSRFSSAGGIRPDTGPTPMMIDLDDPAHARRRALVNQGFTPKQVRSMRDVIERIVDDLIDRVEGRDTFDFVTDLAAWLPLIVIANAMGMDPNDHADLLEWSDDLMRGLGASDPALMEKTIAAFASWQTFITSVIEKRRREPSDDVIGKLVHAEIEGSSLDDTELTFETLLILIGGDETTRHVITGGAYQLLSNPKQWQMLRHDRELLGPAVEEMLRWVSPIKNMARTVTDSIDFHGTRLYKDDKVMLLYPSANRDRDHFKDPDTFDITRSPNDHLAFGAGPHFCLGASLARLELRVIFDKLLDRMPQLRLAEADEPSYRPANFISGYETMPVVTSL